MTSFLLAWQRVVDGLDESCHYGILCMRIESCVTDDTPASWPGWLNGVFESFVDGRIYREEAAGIIPG